MRSLQLINTIGQEITNKSVKSIFLNSYVPYLEKIKANGLYKILPQNNNFTFKVTLPNGNGASAENGNSIPTPPMPPQISMLPNFN